MSIRWIVAAALLALPQVAAAQAVPPKLVHPAQFGTVREVEGDRLMIATARDGCPAADQPTGGGPCFDKLLPVLTKTPARVLGLYAPAQAGNRVAGHYGSDFALFDVHLDGKTLVADRLDLQTSNLTVPDNCFALRGEDVGYVLESENGAPDTAPNAAYESQVVICDGGPDRPDGPYRPEGPVIHATAGHAWHRTEMQQVWGQVRYLATTGDSCDEKYSLRTTWCAQPAVSYLQAHPEVKELDLIAARQPVKAGDILTGKQVDQWVLKHKGDRKFKADSRWVDKSFLTAEAGCTAVESIGWYIQQHPDGLYVSEGALHSCGAPQAPVPVNVYEAYGDDYFIVDCGEHHEWRDKGEHDKGSCFDQAGDYLRRLHQKTATVVVLDEHARVDDYLYTGGYHSYDVAEVTLNDDGSVAAQRVDGYTPNIYLSNCSAVANGPNESHGFLLVRSMGVTWARAYQWMNCPVY